MQVISQQYQQKLNMSIQKKKNNNKKAIAFIKGISKFYKHLKKSDLGNGDRRKEILGSNPIVRIHDLQWTVVVRALMTILEQPLTYIFSKLREFQLLSCGHTANKGQAQNALLAIILHCHLSTWLGVAAVRTTINTTSSCRAFRIPDC